MTDTPPPGSDAAIKAGCTCPIMDNNHGWGYWAEGVYIYTLDCPVHTFPAIDEEDE